MRGAESLGVLDLDQPAADADGDRVAGEPDRGVLAEAIEERSGEEDRGGDTVEGGEAGRAGELAEGDGAEAGAEVHREEDGAGGRTAALGRRAVDIDEFIEKLEATGAFENVVPTQQDRTDEGLYRVVLESVYTGAEEPASEEPAEKKVAATLPPGADAR